MWVTINGRIYMSRKHARISGPVTYNGRPLIEIAREMGVTYSLLYHRMRTGIPFDAPITKRKSPTPRTVATPAPVQAHLEDIMPTPVTEPARVPTPVEQTDSITFMLSKSDKRKLAIYLVNNPDTTLNRVISDAITNHINSINV